MSAKLQQWIFFLEEGGGARFLRGGLLCVAFLALAIFYNVVAYKNFNTEEAMDLAQLARNISAGKGYTTEHIRLISLSLVEAQVNKKLAVIQETLRGGKLSGDQRAVLESQQSELKKLAVLKAAHPDLANAPAYPMLLAGLMKVAPIEFKIPRNPFKAYVPELWIAGLNQILFFIAILVLFKIAAQLFDRSVASISALLFATTELFWHLSISGLPVMLLVLVVLCLVWVLLQFEGMTEPTSVSVWRGLIWGISAGGLIGIGCLTRYAFGWLIFPVILFFALFGTEHRFKICLVAVVTFFLIISPWLARNYSASGNFFGTAGYAVCEGTPRYPENQLDRSSDAAAISEKVKIADYFRKFMQGSRDIFQNEIPRLGGSWLIFFFVAAMLFPMPTPAHRIRVFILSAGAVLGVAYALGRTHLSSESPQVNSENLLVLLSPLAFIFGVAFYFSLVRKIVFPEPVFSYVTTFLFCVIISAPLIFALLPPRVNSSAFPPYHPPLIQETAGWMRPNELMMSDVPWAVAWYGDRQCLSLSQTFAKDYLKINDDVCPIQALFLSPKTTDSRFLFQMVKEPQGWGRFILESLTRNEPPAGFPLRKAPPGFLPDHFFLTDWERWSVVPVAGNAK
ncbi:MAG: glycosyltransferase family 39 protein [Verrucomicrobiota bacterium]